MSPSFETVQARTHTWASLTLARTGSHTHTLAGIGLKQLLLTFFTTKE